MAWKSIKMSPLYSFTVSNTPPHFSSNKLNHESESPSTSTPLKDRKSALYCEIVDRQKHVSFIINFQSFIFEYC